MNVDVKLDKLYEKDSLSNKNYYYLTIKTYKNVFEGKFERSELRYLIQTIDNGI
jgi:hypothetical protein